MTFIVKKHRIRDCQTVEVRSQDGKLLATIVPNDADTSIRVLSKHPEFLKQIETVGVEIN